MRVALARALSILGHPVVVTPIAALIVAYTQGAARAQLQILAAALAAIALAVLGYSWWQVRSGRWSHLDASARTERRTLNLFLAALLLGSAALLWLTTHRPYIPVALALSAAMILAGMLLGRWLKVSLHVAFAAFAAALLWPMKAAFVVALALTAAIAWSRLALGRHVRADIIAALLIGLAAGGAYNGWVT